MSRLRPLAIIAAAFMLAGVGLDASVVSHVRPRLKRRVGEAAFWYAGLAHLAHWTPREFTVEVEGNEKPACVAESVGRALPAG